MIPNVNVTFQINAKNHFKISLIIVIIPIRDFFSCHFLFHIAFSDTLKCFYEGGFNSSYVLRCSLLKLEWGTLSLKSGHQIQ